jgi:hypothetical protein
LYNQCQKKGCKCIPLFAGGAEGSIDQKYHKAAFEAMEGSTARQAADFARRECRHTPKCWPGRLIPGINNKDAAQGIRIRFQNAMRLAGICQICNLDFPVHLGRSLGGTPPSTENGRSANVGLKELQTICS